MYQHTCTVGQFTPESVGNTDRRTTIAASLGASATQTEVTL